MPSARLFPAERTAGARFPSRLARACGASRGMANHLVAPSRDQAVLGKAAGREAAYGTFFE